MSRVIPLLLVTGSVCMLSTPPHLWAVSPKDALDEETEVAFVDTPLKDAVQFISDLHKVKIELAKGVDGGKPVSYSGKGKLRTELRRMLKRLKLTYRIKGDRIVIQ